MVFDSTRSSIKQNWSAIPVRDHYQFPIFCPWHWNKFRLLMERDKDYSEYTGGPYITKVAGILHRNLVLPSIEVVRHTQSTVVSYEYLCTQMRCDSCSLAGQLVHSTLACVGCFWMAITLPGEPELCREAIVTLTSVVWSWEWLTLWTSPSVWYLWFWNSEEGLFPKAHCLCWPAQSTRSHPLNQWTASLSPLASAARHPLSCGSVNELAKAGHDHWLLTFG